MTTGLPPKPTFRAIFGGISLLVILILAFLNIGKLVKYIGATLTFIPSRLGLIQVVSRSEVMPVDFHATPTSILFTKSGHYLLYTDDYDLLVVMDAIAAAKGEPCISIKSETGEPVQVKLIERGLAFYDTPLARGRPVASFEIVSPGVYSMAHPRRPVNIYIVPDYLSGHEGKTTFIIILEITIAILIIWYLIQIRRTRRHSKSPAFNRDGTIRRPE